MHLAIFAFGIREYLSAKTDPGDFPGSPGGGSLPSSAGDTGLILGQETRVPHAMGQPSPPITTRCLKLDRGDRAQHGERAECC